MVTQPAQKVKKTGLIDEPGYPESLTNAEHLLRLSGKQSVLPNFGGEKGYEPNQASQEKTSNYYEELVNVLGEERVCRIGSLSNGTWDPLRKLIVVENPVGSFWQKFGTKVGGIMYALPEEGLFLIEQGVFELSLNGLPLSVEDSWTLLLMHMPSLEYYTVFAFLCRIGFGVISSEKLEYFPIRKPIDHLPHDVSVQGTDGLKEEMQQRQPPKSTSLKSSSTSMQCDDIKSGNLFTKFKIKSKDGRRQQDSNSEIPDKVHSSSIIMRDDGIDRCTEKCSSVEIKAMSNTGTSNYQVSNEVPCCGSAMDVTITHTNAKESSWSMPKTSETEVIKCDKDNLPLVLPQDAVSMEAVMKKLQIIKPRGFDNNGLSVRTEMMQACGEAASLAKEAQPEVINTGTKILDSEGEVFGTGEAVSFTPTVAMTESPSLRELRHTTDGFTTPTGTALQITQAKFTRGVQPLATGKVICKESTSSNKKEDFTSASFSAYREVNFFNVYYKTTRFKKSDPGLPDCRIFPCSYKGLHRGLSGLNSVLQDCNNIPVRFGVCEQGSVSFYSMIPTNVSAVLSNEALK